MNNKYTFVGACSCADKCVGIMKIYLSTNPNHANKITGYESINSKNSHQVMNCMILIQTIEYETIILTNYCPPHEHKL